jgi:hypothetical protein
MKRATGSPSSWPRSVFGEKERFRKLVSGQLLFQERFDVVTDHFRVPCGSTSRTLEANDVTVRLRWEPVRAVAPGKQRSIPAAPDVRAVDDVVRQHDHASGARRELELWRRGTIQNLTGSTSSCKGKSEQIGGGSRAALPLHDNDEIAIPPIKVQNFGLFQKQTLDLMKKLS